MIKKSLKITGLIVSTLAILFGIFLLISTLSDFRPEEKKILQINNEACKPIQIGDTLNLLSWNIGYCGLSREMDFFFEGGEMVRTTEKQVHQNLTVISDYLVKQTCDFYLLQEVDVKSKRSYRINQQKFIQQLLGKYYSSFAKNYDVLHVPVPATKPMGRVQSGLLSLSSFKPDSVIRYSFPGNYNWPTSLFMLDRCFMASYYTLSNGKSLLFVNTHNSAYDDGSLREKQMDYLKDILVNHYKNGGYVIVGGDWNQIPPGFDISVFPSLDKIQNFSLKEISTEFVPNNWIWAYEQGKSTSRFLYEPYKPGETAEVVLDFFLLSPNIELIDVQVQDMHYQNSDHQPVKAVIKIM